MARSFVSTSSQSITVASAASINLGSGDFTVFAWVRFPVAPPNDSMILGKRAGGFDGDEGWELKFNSGVGETIRWDVETDVTGRQRAEGTATNITDGNWHLLAADHTDGAPTGQLQIWYDGAVIATKVAATPGTVNTVTPLVIAAAYNTPNTNYLTGEVAQIYVCSRLLTLAEHQMMAAGLSPLFLRPRPCFLMELASRASPEPDHAGGLFGTLENAPTVADNPRIVRPMAPIAAQDLWYEFGNATVAGQSALTVTATRARQANATVVGQSAVTAVETVHVSVAATIAGQSAVSASVSANVAPEVDLVGQSAVSAAANVLAGVGTIPIVGQSSVSATLSATVPISAQPDGQSSVAADISVGVPVAATVAGQSALTVAGDRIRTLSSSLAAQSATTAAVTITASVAAQIAAQGTLAASLSATVPLAVSISASGDIVADVSALVPVATTVVGVSTVAGALTRAQACEATIAGVSTVTADLAPRVPISTTIAGASTVSADASATASVEADIVALSRVRARPTYPGVKNTITVGGVVRWLATVGGRISR